MSFINIQITNCTSEENKLNREKLKDNFLILLENNKI